VPPASQLSPELAQGLLQLARALLAAVRNWTLYPPDHPTVGTSVTRLADAIRQSSMGAAFALGVTPETLLVEGTPANRNETAIAEAAALLHDRDLIRLLFVGEVPREALHGLLRVLTLDPAERRQRGGPAKIWAAEGHPSIVLDQIDYEQLLSREHAGEQAEARRDDLWRSIVMSIAGGQTAAFDEYAQRRLLDIAGSAVEIGELATAVMEPKCAMDGSPMITSQAATVLAAFRHLKGIVSVMAPDRLPDVMSNIATAAVQLNPQVVMQVMQAQEDPDDQIAVVRSITAAFDDTKVAQLLATALALEGQASDRLAMIFNTIAPDDNRKRRVLTMTRSMLSETDFGRSGQFHVLWTSMEELLVSYNDKPFVSESYRGALDGVGARAERMAAVDLPPELPAWMETLGQESVRTLSVTLLIDLLTLERDPQRAAAIADDMVALAEDLLMSGAYDDARTVTSALAARGGARSALGHEACRRALDRLGESLAMIDTASLLGDVDDRACGTIRAIVEDVGAASIEALKPVVMTDGDTPAAHRAGDLIVGFGAAGVARLASLVADSRWFVQRRAADLLGRIGRAEGVPLLQPLLRKADPRVAQAAISALANIPDPAAARAIHTVLRAATGELRRAVIEALVAERDPRVVPMLVRIVEESEPLGKDHEVVLETIDALGDVPSDAGVAALAGVIARRGFFGRRKLRALKERGVAALARIGSPGAAAALAGAAKTGDRMLRKIAAARG
jgi:HEAT repeat protein